MGRAVRSFNALTGKSLTESEGWLFMVSVKSARATGCKSPNEFNLDDYIDGAAYLALMGECEAAHQHQVREIVSEVPGLRIVEVPKDER